MAAATNTATCEEQSALMHKWSLAEIVSFPGLRMEVWGPVLGPGSDNMYVAAS